MNSIDPSAARDRTCQLLEAIGIGLDQKNFCSIRNGISQLLPTAYAAVDDEYLRPIGRSVSPTFLNRCDKRMGIVSPIVSRAT